MSGGWRALRCVLAAEEPIHIGWHRLGLIERTRLYLPARNLWGMLVSGLAPMLHPGERAPGLYESAQASCRQGLRFTPFFPAAPMEAEDADVWRPGAGKKSEEEVEPALVSSSASTAIAPEKQGAELGSLHEVECLLPRVKGVQAGYVGYLFVREPVSVEMLNRVLAQTRIGGEQRYGWGRLRLAKLEPHKGPVFEQFMPEPDEEVRLVAGGDRYTLPAHLEYKDGQQGLEGSLEVVVGRDWSAKAGDRGGSGQDLTPARLCWAPGTVGEGKAPRRFKIDEHGFWQSV
jgi:hypothetical protein